LPRRWRSPLLVSAAEWRTRNSGPTCARSSCVSNARTVASAMRLLPNRSRKPLLFVGELLQSLGNAHVNERAPGRNRRRRRKIAPFARRGAQVSATFGAVRARGFPHAYAREAILKTKAVGFIHHKRLMIDNRLTRGEHRMSRAAVTVPTVSLIHRKRLTMGSRANIRATDPYNCPFRVSRRSRS